MSLAATVVIEDLPTPTTQYAVHVKYNGRWICATWLDSMREAEVVAEAAHRRSGLPIEVRTLDRELVIAFEPANDAPVPDDVEAAVLQASTC